ncbi:MAG: DUF624 domain-containing protein [Anaerolineae bacterium]|jgi:uncharacterized membrane protein YesL
MTDALKVIGRSLRDWWDEMFLMVGVNLVWGLLAIALVTLFPASMGAYYLTNEKAHGRRVEFDYFWQGFRRYFGQAWALGAINVVFTGLLLTNIWWYSQLPQPFNLLGILWVYALIVWLGALLYVFPLALEQEDKRLLLIYRNALTLAIGRPLFTLVVGLLSLVLLVASIGIPPLLLLVYIPLSALISNHATIDSLEYADRIRATRGNKRSSALKEEHSSAECEGED